MTDLTAEAFSARLLALADEEEARKLKKYFKTGPGDYAEGDIFIGLKMGDVFATAKEFMELPVEELEKMLESPLHELRAGALSAMAQACGRRKTPAARQQALHELYLRRHDRVNNWDLVDLACKQVIGGYLRDKPRDLLYRLAASPNHWERRTAVFATFPYVSKGDLDDLFRLAEILRDDPHDMVQKPVGGMLREAGKKDLARLLAFLDKYAATLPRVTLRYSIEHLTPEQRKHYLGLKDTAAPEGVTQSRQAAKA